MLQDKKSCRKNKEKTMFKALLHKQMLEIRRMYFNRRRRNSNAPSKSGSKGLMILFIFLYIMMLGAFFALSALIGHTLIETGNSWIYFMIMTIMAFLVGIIGNIFSTSAVLFKAKDNEFLLAMPIPPSKILMARMVSVFIMGLVYESMVILPAIAYYFIVGNPSILSIIFCILGIFVLAFMVLVFSCLFGWIAALITNKLKNKAFVTVIISVIFIALFMWFRFRANVIFQNLAEHGQEIGAAVHGWGYPLYALGLGMSGDVLGFLAFTVMTAVLFGLTCLILSKSFKRIVSVKDEGVKADFTENQIRTRKASQALRKKEFKRLTSSPGYMINCGIGLLFILAGAVFLLIKTNDLRTFQDTVISQTPLFERFIPVAGAFAVCLLTSLCDFAAPAISLEGQYIWVLQTLPIDPYQIFRAKLFVHISVTMIPSLLGTAALIFVFRIDVLSAIFMLICVALFICFGASVMLAIDLKRPMLDWTNEMQPIKQSINILIDWIGCMLIAGIFGALYLLLSVVLIPGIYLLICCVILGVLTLLIHKWFRRKGRILFARL